MSSTEDPLAAYSGLINQLTAKFGGHPGIDRASLIHFVSQFDDEHIPIAMTLLENLNYFTNRNISTFLDEIVQLVFDSHNHIQRQKILFLVPGQIWEGDAYVARILRYNEPIPRQQVVSSIDLPNCDPADWDAVVILKDFAGSGNQLVTWWQNTGEALVLRLEAEVSYAILVLNHEGRDYLEGSGFGVISARELEEAQNVFHPSCGVFSDEEKEVLLDYCRKSGASQTYLRGRSENGLAVAFDYGCPNNSLPILWHRSERWSPLFRRHGV
jgi:hypothetical protein